MEEQKKNHLHSILQISWNSPLALMSQIETCRGQRKGLTHPKKNEPMSGTSI